MKKTIISAIAALALGTSAYSDININWAAGAGFYSASMPSGILLGGGSLLAQLIYTSSGSIEDASIGGGVSGDNTVLVNYTVSYPGGTAGSEWADFSYGSEVFAGISTGFVFARVFQDNVVDIGDLYYDSATLAVTPYTGIEAPQTLQTNSDLINGDELTIAVVPEPSVLAFLGLGGLALAARRRFVA